MTKVRIRGRDVRVGDAIPDGRGRFRLVDRIERLHPEVRNGEHWRVAYDTKAVINFVHDDAEYDVVPGNQA